MVLIEEIASQPAEDEKMAVDDGADAAAAAEEESRSDERFRDADEIERATADISRPSARLHVRQLLEKLRREGRALERVAGAASSSSTEGSQAAAAPSPSSAAPVPKRTPAGSVPPSATAKYSTFPTFQVDMGSYNSATISIYLPLQGIGKHDKSKIKCDFTSTSFDLVVTGFDSRDYRMVNDNLDKDIDPSKSKYLVKPNKIIIKLAKVKGEYGYDSWTSLTAKKKKRPEDKKDPSAGIMDLMKDMYDEGDDQMKKMIGETMYKQRTGQLDNKDPMSDMGGMGGMGDMMGGMGGMDV